MKSQFELETTLSNFLSNESIPALQKDLEEKDKKLKAATQSAEENYCKLVAANNAKVEKMRDIILQIDEQTTDLTSKLEIERAENSSLRSSLLDKEDTLKQLEDDATCTKERLNFYQNSLEKLSKENEYLKLAVETAEQDKNEPARLDRDVTRIQLESFENNLQYLQALEQLQGTDENGILSKENSSPQEIIATLDQENLLTQSPVLASLQELATTTDTSSQRTFEELQMSFQEKYQKMLWDELENLPGEAATLSTENNELKDKSLSAEQAIEEKTKEIKSLTEQLAEAKQTQTTLQSKVEDLLRNLNEYEEIFTDTKAELTQAEDNNKELTNQLQSANKLNTLAREHIQTLEKSLSEKDQKLEAAAKNIAQIESLSKQLEAATQMQAFLQTKADGYKSDRDEAKQLATEALEAYQTAKDNESQINEEFNAYHEEMEAFVEQQNAELAAKQSENEDLKSQLETEKMFKDFALELNQNLHKSVDEKDQELKVAAENITQIQLQLEQATEMQEALQAQNSDLNSKLKSAETASKDSTMTIHELQESLRKKDGQLEDISIELETAKLDKEEAKLDAKIAVNEAKENAKKVNNAFVEAQAKIYSLEEERSRLEAANDQAQREIRYLLPRVNDELDIEQQQALLTQKIENNRS